MADNPATPGGATSPPAEGELRRLSPFRRVVARKMAEAWRTIPAVSLHRAVPFARLLAARERLADSDGRKPALDVLLASLVGRALAKHPLLNGSWREDERAVLVNPRRNVANYAGISSAARSRPAARSRRRRGPRWLTGRPCLAERVHSR